MKAKWYEIPAMLRKIILIEVAVLIVIATALAVVTTVRAETYTCACPRGEWVWIRETPEKTGRKIGRVRFGCEIEAGKPENGFIAINTKPAWMLEGEHAARGYVDVSYFYWTEPETLYRVNTTGPLAKRETPEGRLLCWIKPGIRISVLGWRYAANGELWARVYKGGYVSAKYLTEL
ncbi:MAG: hypothetical protein IKM73_07815 [Acidaminococcaceae bacterium]|nr:hypothetical protein [Acidaminococcaceae bacterium]